MAALIEKNQRFLLLSHVRPDGDAIGSQLGLGLTLEALGKQVWMWNDDGVPHHLQFLPESHRVTKPSQESIHVDVVICLDTASRERLGARCLAAVTAPIWLNIDHHVSNPGYGDTNHIDVSSPAAGQIVYQFIKACQWPMPAAARDALYVAVSTDTGSFQYDSTSAATYRMAADLVEQGLKVGEINALIYDNQPFRRIELLRVLLMSLQLEADGQLAWWQLDYATQVRLALQLEDSEGLIDIIRGISGVRVAVFFEELVDGKIRVSLRSKERAVDVCKIAMCFGGGGHQMAAGIRMSGGLESARQQVNDALKEVLRHTLQSHES
jgi:phosphoesterase RecJ-like protein